MPRTARLDVLGVVHHVMARGIDGCTIFRDDQDREEFLRRLEKVVVGGKAQLLAWALIPNHALCGAPHKACNVKLELM